MISLCSFLYSLMLFSELSSHLVTATVPSIKAEDSITEQDGLGLILEDEPIVAEPAAVPSVYRRSQVPDISMRDGGRGSKVIVVSVSVTFDVLRFWGVFPETGNVSEPPNHSFYSIYIPFHL